MSLKDFSEFTVVADNVLKMFSFIDRDLLEYRVEDSVPWINIEAKRVIKPEEALTILNGLQDNMEEQVLFHSLAGRRLRIVVNGKFHFTEEQLKYFSFEEDYAFDFGCPIDEMKEEYGL